MRPLVIIRKFCHSTLSHRAMYGRSEVTEHPSPSTSSAPFPHPQSVIPPLQIEFFNSPFWARFMMQRGAHFCRFHHHLTPHLHLQDQSSTRLSSPHASSHIIKAPTHLATKHVLSPCFSSSGQPHSASTSEGSKKPIQTSSSTSYSPLCDSPSRLL